MPITPIGTLFCPIIKPLSSVFINVTSPTGSLNDATCLSPSAIETILSFVNVNLSIKAPFMPAIFAASTSFWFACNILSMPSKSASALLESALFLIGVGSVANKTEDCFASFAISNNSLIF